MTASKDPVTREFREKASDLGHDVQELGKITKELASDTIHRLTDSASEYYKEGLHKAQNLEKSFEDKIRKNPMEAVLIAAGIGLLLGALWRRR